MFTGYQYFIYFHTETSHIEKVQKRATKFIISLKKYSDKDRLIHVTMYIITDLKRLGCLFI